MRRAIACILSLLLLGISGTALAASGILTASMDKPAYQPGETITVTGNVANRPGAVVTFSLSTPGPDSQVKGVDQTTADANGNFSIRLVLPPQATAGPWLVDVAAVGQGLTLSPMVNGAAPGGGTPGSGTPGGGTPGSGTPGSGTPGSGTPGSGTPGSGTPGSGTPGGGVPGGGTPGSGTPGSGTPGSGTPGSGTPGSGTPGGGTPGGGTPGSGTPGSGTPGGDTDRSEVDSAGGALISSRIRITLPPDAITGKVILTAHTAQVPIPYDAELVGQVMTIEAHPTSGGTLTWARAPLTVALPLTAAIAPDAVLHYYDPAVRAWIAVPTLQQQHWAVGQVRAFSSVAVLRRPSKKAFSDMGDHWALADVLRLQSLRVINGYPDGTFRPNPKITRAEFVKMLVVAAGLQPAIDLSPSLTYSDGGSIPTWALPYVAAARRAGLLGAFGAGAFAADTPVKRGEVTSTLGSLLSVAPATVTFSDVDTLSVAELTALGKTVAAGIITGYEDHSFRPNSPLTRAELAAVMARLIWYRNQ